MQSFLCQAKSPKYVQMEPVGQCNLRCQMCPIQFRRDGPPYGPVAFMDYALYCRLLDQMPALEELQLQGLGEPMMHPRFFDMIAYAARRGIRVGTNSNMTLLSPSRADRCVTSGLADLHISLDGATAETYERIRVGARFTRVIANIKAVQQAKRALQSASPRLRIIVVLMKQNVLEVPADVRLGHRLDIRRIFVQHLCHDFGESSLPAHYAPMRAFVDEQTLQNEDATRVEHYFAASQSAAAELGVELRLPNTQPRLHAPTTPGPERCDWPWHGPYISYHGVAMPCCMIATPDRMQLGDMAEQGVDAVWNGAAYQAFRAGLSSDSPPEVCRSCSWTADCRFPQSSKHGLQGRARRMN
jgi:radical SAM protein with 4Fe4S-binding SPASM domain